MPLSSHPDPAPRPADASGGVTFVGAGPGDPDLLTLRALRELQRADVVLHDRLVGDGILALLPAATRRIGVGKEGFGPSMPQSGIDALMIAEAGAGRRVVRLKAGDPSVFGRLDEEIAALDAAGIAWRVVPGITSALSAAASLGSSLTRRARNTTLRLVSAQSAEGLTECDWGDMARPGAVTAIYMGKRAARFVQGRLLLHGAAPDTPVAVVENASRPDERVIDTVLARLPQDIAAARLAGPAVILLGVGARPAAALAAVAP